MDRDSALIWNPLSEAWSQPGIVPVQWIVHTAVDAPGDTNLHGYFEAHTSLESHTWLRWKRHEQFMPFTRRADANYRANRWWNANTKRYEGAISTETEDDGTPVERPWNAYQLQELIRFGVWLNRTFGIPPRLPASPFAPGMGYHSLFPGVWTNVAGKTCPGSTRIHQFKTIVLPGIQAVLRGDNFMAALNDSEQRELLDRLRWLTPFGAERINRSGVRVAEGGFVAHPTVRYAMDTLRSVQSSEDAITAAVREAVTAAQLDGVDADDLAAKIVAALGAKLSVDA